MGTEIQQIQDELLQLRTEIGDARAHLRTEHRRLRILGGVAIVTVAASILISPANRAAMAQAGTTLVDRVAALEHKTVYMSADTNSQTTTFSACNLRVDNGSGYTTATATNSAGAGLGNIIIGYNEREEGNSRAGCHNLIIGTYNSYSSFGGIVAGSYNTISAAFATVTGGEQNLATGYASSVSGGSQNGTSGAYSSVSGGNFNGAYGNYSSVTGGEDNSAEGANSVVSGGDINTAWGGWASISGGSRNVANGQYSSITGGDSNVTNAEGSTITSGEYNVANGTYSAITGGNHNSVLGQYSSISGGYSGMTDTSAISSSISGGYHDTQSTQNGWMGGSLHSP